jgi:hypothetical protein
LQGAQGLSALSIFRFWSPLAATWFMMAAEGPFVAAIIARLADPIYNLAAYGVALPIGFITEAPIIMMLSASTALVRDRVTYKRLRDFSFAMNALVTLLIATVLLPPVFDGLTLHLLALPSRVAQLAYAAVLMLLPWPAAIGYRRFYHGILISSGKTQLVAYGTGVRLVSMALMGLGLYLTGAVPGAVVGTAALSTGVVFEAIAARLWVRSDVRRLLLTAPCAEDAPLSYRGIGRFYAPLALTPLISMAAQPMTTFFLGHGRLPIESLAVMPVVSSFGFIFRCSGLAFQEVVITLGRGGQASLRALGNFACGLGALSSLAMAAVVLTPLGVLWFEDVSNLTPELLGLAVPAALILVPTPALSMIVSWMHARFVMQRRTRFITVGTSIEGAVIAAVLAMGIGLSDTAGILVAAAAFTSGRLAAAVFLLVAWVRLRAASRLQEMKS